MTIKMKLQLSKDKKIWKNKILKQVQELNLQAGNSSLKWEVSLPNL